MLSNAILRDREDANFFFEEGKLLVFLKVTFQPSTGAILKLN